MTEKEKGRNEYLALREQALKADKQAKWNKVWVDTHYLLCGGLIIAAFVQVLSSLSELTGTQIALSIFAWGAAIAAWAFLGTFPTRRMLKNKKVLHDLQQRMDDLETKYHL